MLIVWLWKVLELCRFIGYLLLGCGIWSEDSGHCECGLEDLAPSMPWAVSPLPGPHCPAVHPWTQSTMDGNLCESKYIFLPNRYRCQVGRLREEKKDSFINTIVDTHMYACLHFIKQAMIYCYSVMHTSDENRLLKHVTFNKVEWFLVEEKY